MPPRAEMGIKPNAYQYNMKILYFGSLKPALQGGVDYLDDNTGGEQGFALGSQVP